VEEHSPAPAQRVRQTLEPLESCTATLKMPGWLGGAAFTIGTRTLASSRLSAAVTTVLLVVAGCLVFAALAGAIAGGIRIPVGVLIASLLMPAAIWGLVHVAGNRRPPAE
jgi:hypothetical protein